MQLNILKKFGAPITSATVLRSHVQNVQSKMECCVLFFPCGMCCRRRCSRGSPVSVLTNLATTLGSREQAAIAEFSEALLVIPKFKSAPSIFLSMSGEQTGSGCECSKGFDRIGCQTSSVPQNKADKQHLAGLTRNLVRRSLWLSILFQFAMAAAITILQIDDTINKLTVQ